MKPQVPADGSSRKEWITYWKKLRDWARKERDRLAKEINRDRRLVAKAEKKITIITQQIEESQVNWNGKIPLPHYTKEVRLCQDYGLYVTATVGRPGVHSATSYHYSSPRYAVDIASGSVTSMVQAQEELLRRFGASHFKELFGPAPWYVKNGQKISGAFPAHGDHIHFAT